MSGDLVSIHGIYMLPLSGRINLICILPACAWHDMEWKTAVLGGGGEVKTREDLSSCRSQIGKYGGLKRKRKKWKREGKKGRREKQKQKQVIHCTPH